MDNWTSETKTEREQGLGKWVSMHRTLAVCVWKWCNCVKHQGQFWKAQGASGSIREPQGRVSEAVACRRVTGCNR